MPMICPLMSGPLHNEVERNGFKENEDYSYMADCVEEKCAWWIASKTTCAVELLARFATR